METLQRTANRGSVSTGFNIDNSIMFTTQGTYADSGGYFYDVIASSEGWAANSNAGTNARKCTVSAWVKRTALTESSHYPRIFSYRAGGVAFDVFFDPSSDQLTMYDDNTSMSLKTNRSFRDTAAWLHIVVAVDQTQGTAANRVKVYVNGVQETSWATEDYGNQNVDLSAFRAAGTNVYVGGAANDASAYFNGYISEYNFIDGAQLAQTDFGEFDSDTGIWIPKKFTGSYGTLGHFYNFTVASDMGKDFSGNGNDCNNRGDGIANGAARQATDTPTNNFCTWNPLVTNAGVFTYADGATKWKPSSGNWQTTTASMGFTKGKWYAEFKMDGDVTAAMVGLQELEKTTNYVGNYLGYFTNSTSMGLGYYNADGKIYKSAGSSSYGASYPSSVLVGVAIEYKDDGVLNLYVAKDNVWQNSADPANGTGGFGLNYGSAVDGFFSFAASLYQNPGYWQANFGGYTVNSISSAASDANGYGTFEYAPPSGYYALCTKNLAEFG